MPHYPQVPLDNRLIHRQTHQSGPGYAAPIKQGFTMAGIWCRRGSGRNVTTAHDLSPISGALAAYDLSITHRNGNWGFIMQDAFDEWAKKTAAKKGNDRKTYSEAAASAGCYGQIGISAGVDAVRYQGSAKNPAYAPVSTKWRDLIAEAAA